MAEGWGRPINMAKSEPTHWWTNDNKILCRPDSGMGYIGPRTRMVKPDNACGDCIDRISTVFPTISDGAFKQLMRDIDEGLFDPELQRLLAEEEEIERKARKARDELLVQNPKRDAYRHILNLVETLKKSGCHGQTIVQVIEEVCQAQGK